MTLNDLKAIAAQCRHGDDIVIAISAHENAPEESEHNEDDADRYGGLWMAKKIFALTDEMVEEIQSWHLYKDSEDENDDIVTIGDFYVTLNDVPGNFVRARFNATDKVLVTYVQYG